jgi:valyl-tRNA synthetase
MSKSKGNVISPLDMMEKFGSDALRFSYVIGSSAGQDFRMSEEKIGGYRNFINKIWNATRFVVSKYGDKEIPKFDTAPVAKTVYDKWMLDSLQDLIEEERKALEQYDFNRAGTALYEFIWFTYCDWYLEVNKGENENLEMLVYVLSQLLKLLHPMIPFITESVWQKLYSGDVLALSSYPAAAPRAYAKEKEMVNEIFAIVSAVRATKAQLGVAKGGNVVLKGNYITTAAILSDIKMLAGVDSVLTGENAFASFIKQSTSSTEIFFEVSKEQSEALAAAAQKEIAELTAGIERTEKLLSNENFVKNAKPEIVAGEQKKIADWKARLAKLQQS